MNALLGFAMPGGWEWLVVLIVALLIFGSRLPKMMRGLGSSVKEFRHGMDDATDEDGKKLEPKDAEAK